MDDQKNMVDLLKEQRMIVAGKSEVFNPVQDLFNLMHVRMLPPNSIIIFVFDTDKPETDTLIRNLKFLRSRPSVHDVICIPQVRNFEDEIIRSTDIHHLRDFFHCDRDSEFKQRFLEERRLISKLSTHQFDPGKFWSSSPDRAFLDKGIVNDAAVIKVRK